MTPNINSTMSCTFMRAAFVLLLFIEITTMMIVHVEAAAESERPLLRIGMVADNHYDTFPAGEKAPWQPLNHWYGEQIRRTTNTNKRRYDVAKDKMDEAIDVFNRVEDMTMVVNLGDLVNNDLMWNLKPILDSFNRAKAPHYNLLGNHDLRAHNDRFGKDNKTQHDWIRGKMGTGKQWYFTLHYPPFRIIFVDSMIMEPENKNMTRREEHLAWLRQEVSDAAAAKEVVIFFAHIPVGFDTNKFLGPVFKSYQHVVAAFFGHDHKGRYIKQQSTHCVTIQGQIETLTNSFAVVDFFRDRIELTGFGRVPSRVMKIDKPTADLLMKFDRSQHEESKFDLSLQGHQPLPPSELWPKDEKLQTFPPLLLKIPNYKKPKLSAAEANPGDDTMFMREYRTWPKRILTPSPEDPVDLNSHQEGRPVILSAAPAVGGGGGGRHEQEVPVTPTPNAVRVTRRLQPQHREEEEVEQRETTPTTKSCQSSHGQSNTRLSQKGQDPSSSVDMASGMNSTWLITPTVITLATAVFVVAIFRRRAGRGSAGSRRR